MRVLLELGAAVDAESHGGTTPLHLCSANDDVKSLKFLLTSGAKVNTKNKDGMTALYLAAFYGANRAITILLDSGAFPDEQVWPSNEFRFNGKSCNCIASNTCINIWFVFEYGV